MMALLLTAAIALAPSPLAIVSPPDRIQDTFFQVQAFGPGEVSCGPSPIVHGAITNGTSLLYDRPSTNCIGNQSAVVSYSVLWSTNSAGPWTAVDVGLDTAPRLMLTTNWTLVYSPIPMSYSRGYILTSTNSTSWDKMPQPFFTITNNTGQVGQTLYRLVVETSTNAP